MVAQLASFKFDDGLHDGILEQGIGTTAIEVKLAQCLAWGDQCPLYQIYVDLKKAYDVLDMERMLFFRRPMESGQGCCPSPEALFLGHSKIGVPGLEKLQGTFNAKRGITPWGPFSSLMFNACIDFLVREMDFFVLIRSV
jgi:hypothetical protein